jgi:ribosomal protein L21
VYAIVQTRGRQVKVTPGAVIEIDGTPGERGSAFTFEQVLLIEKDAGDIVAGAPFVANAKVEAAQGFPQDSWASQCADARAHHRDTGVSNGS